MLIAHEQIAFVGPRLPPNYEAVVGWKAVPKALTDDVTAIVVAGDTCLEESYLAQFPNLGLIACLSTGYDGVDVRWAARRGIKVTRAVEVNHEDVADHALGLLIAWTRGLVSGDRLVRSGEWSGSAKIVTRSLRELSVGVVGMGAIGKAVAARCALLGLPVSWWGPRPKDDVSFPRLPDLMTLANENDVLIVACKADSSNRHMIDGAILDALGPRGLLVNVARGRLVDEDALVDRLRSGRLAGAALDVFENEPTDPVKWRNLANVIVTPHSAGTTRTVMPKLVDQLILNLNAFFEGRELPTAIAA
ncbi:hypothetical protein ASC90_07750 [Rhizobium sp. Root1220]|nr:hypothetical protein ASC90_07750 [Rhizobium sp. Root1220]